MWARARIIRRALRRLCLVLASRTTCAPLSETEDSPIKHKIALQHSDQEHSDSVPSLPDCWSQGKTEAKAIANRREAIREHLVVRDDPRRDVEVHDFKAS